MVVAQCLHSCLGFHFLHPLCKINCSSVLSPLTEFVQCRRVTRGEDGQSESQSGKGEKQVWSEGVLVWRKSSLPSEHELSG